MTLERTDLFVLLTQAIGASAAREWIRRTADSLGASSDSVDEALLPKILETLEAEPGELGAVARRVRHRMRRTEPMSVVKRR